jgi:hypothetical protein
MGLQTLENKVLSRGSIGKSAPILAEITIRKSQFILITIGSSGEYREALLLAEELLHEKNEEDRQIYLRNTEGISQVSNS